MLACKRCLLPGAVPGAMIDNNGICSFCRDYEKTDGSAADAGRKEREIDLEKAIKDCKGKGSYDCLVPVSGGKDSVYLLYKLKVEYGLKVLAFTTDINIPALAWQNINLTLKKLDIDHLSFKPSFSSYTKIFRYLLQNQEERGAVYTVSYVYAPLFEGDAIKLALERGIPVIFAGYSPGQPEPERMFYEFSPKLIRKVDWTPPGLRESGVFSESELSIFYNPKNLPTNTNFPRYLAPYHAWEYNQGEIMKKVVELGLVGSSRHASPIFSNYPINWLLMYSDILNFGYNPYHPEFSTLIREGKASKIYWKMMSPIVNWMIRKKVMLGREVTKNLQWLNLKDEDLKITRPKGAYDPIIPSI